MSCSETSFKLKTMKHATNLPTTSANISTMRCPPSVAFQGDDDDDDDDTVVDGDDDGSLFMLYNINISITLLLLAYYYTLQVLKQSS